MIGRAAATNPWIFRRCSSTPKRPLRHPTDAVRYRLLMDYYRQIMLPTSRWCRQNEAVRLLVYSWCGNGSSFVELYMRRERH